MLAKRPNGTGSVYQRGDGYWVVSVTIGDRRVVKYRKSQKDAQELLAILMVAQSNHTLTAPSRLTLAEWAEQWIELNSQRLRPSTILAYRQTLKHVTNVLGNTRLDKLTPLMLTRTFTDLGGQGVGARRINLAHTYLRTCLSQAVDLNIIATNPMIRVKKPHWEQKEREYWSIEEASRFINHCLSSDRKWAPLFAFLTTTGLRISEVLGLTWNDVDWMRNEIRISKALVWASGEPHVLPPKTKAGRRSVALTESATRALQMIPRTTDNDECDFMTSFGTNPSPSHLRKYLHDLCDGAGVRRLHIHGLRHVAAMLALEAVGDPYLVQQRLGHADVGITLRIYGYPAKKEREFAVGVDRLLGGFA